MVELRSARTGRPATRQSLASSEASFVAMSVGKRLQAIVSSLNVERKVDYLLVHGGVWFRVWTACVLSLIHI